MKDSNEGSSVDALERRLRAGLRRKAGGIRPEAQVFWTHTIQRLAKIRRDRGASKQV